MNSGSTSDHVNEKSFSPLFAAVVGRLTNNHNLPHTYGSGRFSASTLLELRKRGLYLPKSFFNIIHTICKGDSNAIGLTERGAGNR